LKLSRVQRQPDEVSSLWAVVRMEPFQEVNEAYVFRTIIGIQLEYAVHAGGPDHCIGGEIPVAMTDTTYSEPIGIVATVFRAVFFLILDHWMVSSLWIR